MPQEKRGDLPTSGHPMPATPVDHDHEQSQLEPSSMQHIPLEVSQQQDPSLPILLEVSHVPMKLSNAVMLGDAPLVPSLQMLMRLCLQSLPWSRCV